MAKHGKKYRAALEKIEEGRKYSLDEGLAKVKEVSAVTARKFDETVELTMWLGVDPRKADQLVRGTVVLPHGVGKTVRVLVIAQGEKVKEAEEAGADIDRRRGHGRPASRAAGSTSTPSSPRPT